MRHTVVPTCVLLAGVLVLACEGRNEFARVPAAGTAIAGAFAKALLVDDVQAARQLAASTDALERAREFRRIAGPALRYCLSRLDDARYLGAYGDTLEFEVGGPMDVAPHCGFQLLHAGNSWTVLSVGQFTSR